MYRYKVIEMRDRILGRTAYGIVAEYGNGHTAVVPHLSCDKAFVSRLAERCERGQVEPEHLLDVVTDALLL